MLAHRLRLWPNTEPTLSESGVRWDVLVTSLVHTIRYYYIATYTACLPKL